MEKTSLELLKEYRDIVESAESIDNFENKKCPNCYHSPIYKEEQGSKHLYYCHNCNKSFDKPLYESSLKENRESPVVSAVMWRIERSHPEILEQYGYDVVEETVRDFYSDRQVEEIGSSDVSIWTKQVVDYLESLGVA